MTFTRVSIIVAVTAVVVYFGLNVLWPRNLKEKAASAGVSADEVFGGAAATTTGGDPATATAETSTPAPPAAEPSTPAPAPEAAAAPAPTTDESSAATSEPAAPASTDTAATPAPASSPTPDSSGLTADEARKIAENVSRNVANRVVDSSASSTPSSAASDSSSSSSSSSSTASDSSSSGSTNLTETDVRRIATEVAREVVGTRRHGHAAAAADTTVASDSSTASAEPTSRPARSHHASSGGSKASHERIPAPAVKIASASGSSMDSLTSWYPITSKASADKLSLVYAGEAASEKAVALLFNGVFSDASSASSNIQVVDSKGSPANGEWALGTNPRLLVFKGLAPGRYTVLLKPQLADAGGKTLGSELHGPIYIH